MSTIEALDHQLSGSVHRPGTSGFAEAVDGFDLSAIPAPDLAVPVVDEQDVATAVRFAAGHQLPVAVRATGHGPIRGVDRGLLINTRALATVTVDPVHRTATAGAGVTWTRVLQQCAPLGLVPVCGSSPTVGVVAYTLGGGLSPVGRRHGWAADRVRRIRLVTPDGELREITAETDPDLFWAVRGGGGNFGVATELEFDLVDGTALQGGGLSFPGEMAAEVLATFAQVTAAAPDDLTLSVAMITFPDLEVIAAPLRGRFVAQLRVAYVGSAAEAAALLAPFRAVAAPLVDTVRPLPITEFGTIHNDPTRPQPVSCGGAVLTEWDDRASTLLLDGIGPSRPFMMEIRHLGGALGRPAAVPNAVGQRDARFNVFTSAYPGPSFVDAAAQQTELYQRLEPFTGGRSLYNFTARPDGDPGSARTAFDADTFGRLQHLKGQWDPQNLFRFNVAITPASPDRMSAT